MKLKDLADRLGLSQTTVSRALNGYPEVSEATRERVLDAARRFDYRPNASARRLATGRAGAIGAVLQTDRNLLLDPHYVEFLAGLGERLAEDEIDIVLSPTRGNDEIGELPAHRRRHARRCADPVEPADRGRPRQAAHRARHALRPARPHDQPAAACLARHRQRGRLPPRHQAPPRSRPYAHRADQRRDALHLRRRIASAASAPRSPSAASPSTSDSIGEGPDDRRGRLPLRRALPRRDGRGRRRSWSRR